MDSHANAQAIDDHFDATLAKLEMALEMPAMAGEIPQWAEEVRTQAHAFDRLLQIRLDARHEKTFEQIEKEDPELLRRVELMRADDEGIRVAYAALIRQIDRLDDRGERIEPQEAEAPWVDRLREEGTRLVVRIRTQELAVKAWLSEALNRDRGVPG